MISDVLRACRLHDRQRSAVLLLDLCIRGAPPPPTPPLLMTLLRLLAIGCLSLPPHSPPTWLSTVERQAEIIPRRVVGRLFALPAVMSSGDLLRGPPKIQRARSAAGLAAEHSTFEACDWSRVVRAHAIAAGGWPRPDARATARPLSLRPIVSRSFPVINGGTQLGRAVVLDDGSLILCLRPALRMISPLAARKTRGQSLRSPSAGPTSAALNPEPMRSAVSASAVPPVRFMMNTWPSITTMKGAILLPQLAAASARTPRITVHVLLSLARLPQDVTSFHHIFIPVTGIEDSVP